MKKTRLTPALVVLVALVALSPYGRHASAQDFPFFVKDPPGNSGSLIQPGMAYWWIYTNLVEGVNIGNGVVTNWPDIISGSILKKAGSTNAYKTTEGVRIGYNLTADSYLTNVSTIPLGTNTAWAMILKPVYIASYVGYNFLRGMQGASPLSYSWEGGSYQAQLGQYDPSVANLTDLMIYTNLMDCVLVRSNVSSGTARDYFFTNGVFSAYADSGLVNVNLDRIGGPTTSAYNGFIKEIQVYTNSTDWTLWASNFHVYRTTTYGN